ncbi:MAG: acyl-CoA dehydrogenase family protein [Sulfuritalea sp.]|jgi:alkylation response protein AidB-like acyl-CoA dehydrogenase|nr:acyl-CoA dehydrogenase family protein [Sulfuritalea sp.]
MNFDYSEEQLALQDTLRRFIDKEYRFDQRRTLAQSEDGFSREVWAQLAELGLLALPFPEEYGGLGGNAVDTMLVMEVLGRGLVLEPYLGTVVLAGSLIRDAGTLSQKDMLLPAIAGGELLMTLAHYEPGTRYEMNHIATTAKSTGNSYLINGAKSVVLGGNDADKIVVSARTGGGRRDNDGISLFVVGRTAPGLIIRGYPTQDGSRAAETQFDNVEVGDDALLGTKDGALPIIERAIDYAIVALCAEAVGIMTALNEATLDYLKTRKQFGQPIGRFQALQHRMVDMVIATEQARSMATLSAVRVDSIDAAERRRVVSAAKAYVGQSARSVGQAAVQLHGGMGVVDELNVSHYFKRLTMINATFGDTDHHLGIFSDLLLAD